MKYLLLLSIEGKLENASTFVQRYLGDTDTDETVLNIGECEVND